MNSVLHCASSPYHLFPLEVHQASVDDDGDKREQGQQKRTALIDPLTACVDCALSNFNTLWQANFGAHELGNGLLCACNFCCFRYCVSLVLEGSLDLFESEQKTPREETGLPNAKSHGEYCSMWADPRLPRKREENLRN